MGIRINGSSGGYVEIGVPANPSNRNITLPDTDGEALVGTTNGAVELPSGNTLQRPTGAAGQIRFNTDTGKMEYWSSTSDTPQWLSVTQNPINVVSVEYLVVGAGGGGSGSNANAPSGNYYAGKDGSDSVFHTLTAGGGGGGARPNTNNTAGNGRASNGSGGGGAYNASPGTGVGTGGAGGTGYQPSPYSGAGGGGAGGNGANGTSSGPGNGGVGVTTTIITTAQATANSVGEVSGSSVYFSGGGGGSDWTHGSTAGSTGGLGGGSDVPGTVASPNTNQYQGTPNTGGGGGAEPNQNLGGAGGGGGGVLSGTLQVNTGSALIVTVGEGATPENNVGNGKGGSGVVILKYPATKTATFSSGVTSNTITDGSNKITFVTATSSVTENVTFS